MPERSGSAAGGLAAFFGKYGGEAMKLVAGNSNRALAEAIANYLDTPLTKCVVRRFADMEIFVEIEENVRGEDVFIIQSTSFPANDHLMELLIIIDALRRASARRITAVIPYFGYARQDRKPGPRAPISAKLVANLITEAGADRVLTLDLHAGQIQGFFDIPTDNLYAAPTIVRDIHDHFKLNSVMVVSPDVGGVVRARGLAKRIGEGKVMTGEQTRWGLENLSLDEKKLEALGFAGVMRPVSTTCADHMGPAWARIHTWNGSKWEFSSDWYQADESIIKPMVKTAAAKYAAEKKITPRTAADCQR